MSTTFWFNQPSILLKQTDIIEIWPAPAMSTDRKLNAITRLIILLTLFGYLVTRKHKFIITGLITLVVIVILHHIQKNKGKNKQSEKEGFVNADLYKKYEMYYDAEVLSASVRYIF